MKIIQSIQQRIYELRGQRVILDFDLAVLYEVDTRILNQTVKRNLQRFPKDFMFQLKSYEYNEIKMQCEKLQEASTSQFVMMRKFPQNRTNKYLPYAFTEQGVAMLSGVLNSDKAIQMNIAIMRAFIKIKSISLSQKDIKEQLLEIRKQLTNHDMNIVQINEAIENLLDENVSKLKWERRKRIGFKQQKE